MGRVAPPSATPTQELMRLNRRMAELGLCSRREADDWIARGWVRVNGAAAVLGQRVGADDRISTERAAQHTQAQRVTILLHKPVGVVSAQPEDGHRAAVDLICAASRWAQDASTLRFAPQHLRALAAAGRLDIDSTGLLVLTQDGRVARRLIAADSGIEKEYLVRVEMAHAPTADARSALAAEKLSLLCHGLSLDGQALRPAQVQWQNAQQLRFVLQQGKKRQIRRMCEAVGLRVTALKRVRVGRVVLGALPPGQWRYLGRGEDF